MILQVLVHEADIQDEQGGKLLLAPLRGVFPRLPLIWADSRYKCSGFPEWVKAALGWTVEIVAHPSSGQRGVWTSAGGPEEPPPPRPSGFQVLPSSEEAWIYLAMIRTMLRRLACNSS